MFPYRKRHGRHCWILEIIFRSVLRISVPKGNIAGFTYQKTIIMYARRVKKKKKVRYARAHSLFEFLVLPV